MTKKNFFKSIGLFILPIFGIGVLYIPFRSNPVQAHDMIMKNHESHLTSKPGQEMVNLMQSITRERRFEAYELLQKPM